MPCFDEVSPAGGQGRIATAGIPGFGVVIEEQAGLVAREAGYMGPVTKAIWRVTPVRGEVINAKQAKRA